MVSNFEAKYLYSIKKYKEAIKIAIDYTNFIFVYVYKYYPLITADNFKSAICSIFKNIRKNAGKYNYIYKGYFYVYFCDYYRIFLINNLKISEKFDTILQDMYKSKK